MKKLLKQLFCGIIGIDQVEKMIQPHAHYFVRYLSELGLGKIIEINEMGK
jgi:hypothetical protein